MMSVPEQLLKPVSRSTKLLSYASERMINEKNCLWRFKVHGKLIFGT
jgi:hypothetical protein